MRPWNGGGRAAATALFDVNIGDMLPVDHDAWRVLELVDDLDLSEFEGAYRLDGVGRPPYAPKMMIGLILYCSGKNIHSGRGIARACRDDLGCRLITGNQFPDRSVIDDFRRTHGAAWRGLLVQTLRLGHVEGLVDVSVVAGDGTMVKANASKSALMGKAKLKRQITRLKGRLENDSAAWTQLMLDAPTGGGRGGGQTGDGGVAWQRMQVDARLLDRREAALRRLEQVPSRAWREWAERMRAAQERLTRARERLGRAEARQADLLQRWAAVVAGGGTWMGRVPMPMERAVRVIRQRASVARWDARIEALAAQEPELGSVNVTDPDAAVMPGKHGGHDLYYNLQAVCSRGPFVLSVGIHPSSNDKQALTTGIRQARANLDSAGITDPIGTALYDCGYASEANFSADLPVENLLVSVARERHQTGRDNSEHAPHERWQAMAQRLARPANAELYRLRGSIIEPLFAQLFAHFGRELTLRGLAQVTTEIHIWAATHNLRKIMRSRARTRAA